jgi:ABC-type Fe3+/spermidine/putrescine transport system ATPase subunit
MDKGVIQQIGDPQTIYARPANRFVANFIGAANLMPAVLVGRDVGLCELEISLGQGAEPVRVRAAGGDGATNGQTLYLSVRPEDLVLNTQSPAANAANVLEGEVIDTVYLGNFLECRVRVGCHEVGVQIDHYEQLAPQQKVFLSFEPDHGLCLTA